MTYHKIEDQSGVLCLLVLNLHLYSIGFEVFVPFCFSYAWTPESIQERKKMQKKIIFSSLYYGKYKKKIKYSSNLLETYVLKLVNLYIEELK